MFQHQLSIEEGCHAGKAIPLEALPSIAIDRCEARSGTVREIIYRDITTVLLRHVDSDLQDFWSPIMYASIATIVTGCALTKSYLYHHTVQFS